MKVFIIAALSADGLIARHAEHFAGWSSAEDKKQFVELTKEAGVMVMGSRTFTTINRALPGRRTIVYTSKPEQFTVEGAEATNELPEILTERLKGEGAKGVAICGGASIYDMFIRAELVDELYLTIEPLVFGQGLTLFTSQLDIKLKLLDTKQLNQNSIRLHYKVG